MWEYLKTFFKIWLSVLLLNQILIFHGCMAPYCIIAALPHTFIISVLISSFLNKFKKHKNETKKENSSAEENIAQDKEVIFDNPSSKHYTAKKRSEEISLSDKSEYDDDASCTFFEDLDNENKTIENVYHIEELPLFDGMTYRGYVKEKFDENIVALNIVNVGTFVVEVPVFSFLNYAGIDEPFDFVRKKNELIFVNENSSVSSTMKEKSSPKSETVSLNFERVSNKTKSICKREHIIYYDVYYSWGQGKNSKFNKFSSRILDLKKGKKYALDYFFHILKDMNFDNVEAIVVVPSHDPENNMSRIKWLAKKLAEDKNLIDATDCIVRTKKIAKLATGGNRDISVHIQSLAIQNSKLIEGKKVLVFDDIATTGHSIQAVMQLLKKHGAYSVCAFVIGYTEHR
jgi:hypothetical protein